MLPEETTSSEYTEPQIVRRNLRHNFTVNVLDLSFTFFGLGLVNPYTFIPVLVQEFSSAIVSPQTQPLLIAFLGAINPVGRRLPQLFSAGYIESLKRVKPFVLFFGLLDRIPYLLLAVAAYLLGICGGAWILALFFLAYILQKFSAGFVATGSQELIAKVIPLERRGIFYGTAFFLGGLSMAAGGHLSSLILHSVSSPLSYSLCFVFCFAAAVFSLSSVSLTKEGFRSPSKPKTTLSTYLKRVAQLIGADKNWRRYILSRTTIVLGAGSSIFVSVWGWTELSLAPREIGYMTIAAALGETASNPLFGYLGDRYGHKLGLVLSSSAYVFAIAALITWPHRTGLYIALLLIGVYQSGRRIAETAIAYEFSSPVNRPTYIGLTSTVLAPFFAAGPLIAGFLVMKWGYKLLFTISLLLTAAGAVYLATAVREPRKLAEANHL